MRYTNSGIEIQYRECQIARDAAKALEGTKGNQLQLESVREAWIGSIKTISDSQKLKQEDCSTLINFITNMPNDQYDAFSEFVEVLVKKGKGIDILIPYISRNGIVLTTVNRHDERTPDEY